VESKRLVNASIVGGLLAILGVGLFLLLYVGLGAADIQGAPRLFGALCTPPVVIGLIVGTYWLTRRSNVN
jgi:hypothetical protein